MYIMINVYNILYCTTKECKGIVFGFILKLNSTKYAPKFLKHRSI